MQTSNIQHFDLTVRVGCSLVYEVTGTASLLLNLKLCPDRNHAVLSEALALGNNLPAEEFSDSHGNCVFRVKLAHGTNCFRHDAIVAVSSQPDNHAASPRLPIFRFGPTKWHPGLWVSVTRLILRSVSTTTGWYARMRSGECR